MRGLAALVGRAVAGARQRLFRRVASSARRTHRHAGRLRRAHDAVRRRLRDVVEVRRLAADQAAEADDRADQSPVLGERAAPPAPARTRRAPRTSRCPSSATPASRERRARAGLEARRSRTSWYAETTSAIRTGTVGRATGRVNVGLALLEKRARAFAHVVGRRDEAEERRLVVLRVGERHLEAAGDGVEDVAHGDRRLRRQRAARARAPRSSAAPPARRD